MGRLRACARVRACVRAFFPLHIYTHPHTPPRHGQTYRQLDTHASTPLHAHAHAQPQPNCTSTHACKTGNHRVQVYDKKGKYQATIGSGEASYRTGEFRNPSGISVDGGKDCNDKNGYLYVIEWGNHRVQARISRIRRSATLSPFFPLPSSLFPLPSSLFPFPSSRFPLLSSLFPSSPVLPPPPL